MFGPLQTQVQRRPVPLHPAAQVAGDAGVAVSIRCSAGEVSKSSRHRAGLRANHASKKKPGLSPRAKVRSSGLRPSFRWLAASCLRPLAAYARNRQSPSKTDGRASLPVMLRALGGRRAPLPCDLQHRLTSRWRNGRGGGRLLLCENAQKSGYRRRQEHRIA